MHGRVFVPMQAYNWPCGDLGRQETCKLSIAPSESDAVQGSVKNIHKSKVIIVKCKSWNKKPNKKG